MKKLKTLQIKKEIIDHQLAREELASVVDEAQQMNNEGATAPNHQLAAGEAGQFSINTGKCHLDKRVSLFKNII